MADAAADAGSALDALRCGGVVAYPTETLYGLGADARSETALERLVAIKGRDGKPISVLVASRAMLDTIAAAVSAPAERLMRVFWPGPLTIALPARPGVSRWLTGGGTTIAARISSHPLAHALTLGLGAPITSTSANPAGAPPPSEIGAVRAYFGEAIDAYVDGGPTAGGPGSTVVDCAGDGVRIIREGAIAAAAVESAAGVRLRAS